MKWLILVLSIASSLAQADDGFFKQKDKQQHMVGSAVIGATLLGLGFEKHEAFAATVAIGILKEIADGNRNSNKEHAMDLAADVIGASTVFVWRIEF